MNIYKKIIPLFIILLIIVGFISYKIYEKFQIIECSTVKNCKTCTKSFGCLWCKKSNKCISDLSKNMLCFQESTVSDPFGCDIDSVEDISGLTLNSPLFGGRCSNNKDCSTCLRSPDCFWCNDSQKCAGSVELYAQCKDDATIYNSSNQCSNSKSTVPESTIPFDPKDTVIPMQGLTRATDGSLTKPSLQIIFDSLSIQDMNSMDTALNRITKEMNFYKNQYKTNMNTFVDNTIDYVTDTTSLNNAKINNQRLDDLRDVSRYVNDYGTAFLNQTRPQFSSKDTMDQITGQDGIIDFFTNKSKELFVDTYVQKDVFDYNLQKNKLASGYLELFWAGNIIAIGILYYFMNI